MLFTLNNGIIEVKVKSLGAELTSFKDLKEDKEYLWQSDSQYWLGQSPILFPIVGGIPDGKFEVDGKTYEMSSHGFAKKSEFEPVVQSENELELGLKANEETLKQYPYNFEIFVIYRISGNTLYHGFKVNNLDNKVMLFSVGAHAGFKCPWTEGETIDDYRMVFEKPEKLERRIKIDPLLSTEKEQFMDGECEKPLTHNLFYNDAIILDSVKSNWVEIRSNKNPSVIHVDFKGFPYLGIWSCKNDGPFVCIEPWYGIDSTYGDSHDLAKKEGIQRVNPGACFQCEYSIKITV